ncbi:MAG: peptide chain release factor N(5)-glutamine methyltransferase [Pirellulaceae bacterium]|nr:peptide chain release factor N(5)-glutamine methyltransferase [Pirellulaceae bacterium]
MSEESDWTIGRLLTWTSDYLTKQGSTSPRLDAEVLLADACGCERIDLYTAFDRAATETVRVTFREMVRRRAEGTPVAYLVGKREFYSLSFRVTPDVLIPRPETEHLVIETLDLIKTLDGKPIKIVDVGSGSGNVSVAIAKHAPSSQITAVDISKTALEIARKNVETHQVQEQVSLVAGDLLEGFNDEPQFDFVVSNPPYVSEAELTQAACEVKDYEPHIALLGGPQGTEIIARLVQQSTGRLKSGGWLLLEFSPMIATLVADLIDASSAFEDPVTTKDLAGLTRVIKARRR